MDDASNPSDQPIAMLVGPFEAGSYRGWPALFRSARVRDNGDGTQTISIGFPLMMFEPGMIQDPQRVLEWIVKALNSYDRAMVVRDGAAERSSRAWYDRTGADPADGSDDALRRVADMIDEWAPDTLPAVDGGRVPFSARHARLCGTHDSREPRPPRRAAALRWSRPMKITTVRFRQLKSHDRGYGHDAVEAEAQVDEGETAEQVLEALRNWVGAQLGQMAEASTLADRIELLRVSVHREERRLDGLGEEIKRANAIIGEHEELEKLARERGLGAQADLLRDVDDGVPF